MNEQHDLSRYVGAVAIERKNVLELEIVAALPLALRA